MTNQHEAGHSICENTNCRLGREIFAPTWEELLAATLAHHIMSKPEEDPGSLRIQSAMQAIVERSDHACRSFRVFDLEGRDIGIWHFASGSHQGRYSTAKIPQ